MNSEVAMMQRMNSQLARQPWMAAVYLWKYTANRNYITK